MSKLVRYRRFRDGDGFVTGAMEPYEDGGWVRYEQAANRIRELETALVEAVAFLRRRTAGQEANGIAAEIERLL